MSSSTSELFIPFSLAPHGPANKATKFEAVQGNFSDIHKVTEARLHSGIVWNDGIRKATNFQSCQVLMLDVDGTWSLEEAKEEFKDTRHVLIATSKSHQKPNKIDELGKPGKTIARDDFFHIYIGLEKPITDKDEYTEVMQSLVKHYPVDKSVKDAARFFFPNQSQMYWYS